MNRPREVRIVSLRSEIIINDYSCYPHTFFNHVCPRDTRQIVTRGALMLSPIRHRIMFVNHTAGDYYYIKGQIHLERKTISCLIVSERNQSGITPSKLTQQMPRILHSFFTVISLHQLGLALIMGGAVSTTNFSNFAHDCQGTEFNGDLTTVIGTNCLSNSSNGPHSSWLNLDLCLSYEAPNLVAHQGYTSRRSHEKYKQVDADIVHGSGGYVSTSKCTNCSGNVNSYSCYCCASDAWTWASIDLSRLVYSLLIATRILILKNND